MRRVMKEKVQDVSAKLDAAIRGAKEDEKQDVANGARAHAKSIVFESAHAPKEIAAGTGLDALAARVFVSDHEIEETYAWIESTLALGARLGEHGYRVKALDLAETAYRKAHRLFITVKLTRETWERDNEVNFAHSRVEATKALQQEKDAGYRSKQITDADVNAKCAEMFPDEWRVQEHRRSKYKLTEDSILNLVDVCSSRCRTMQTLVGKG